MPEQTSPLRQRMIDITGTLYWLLVSSSDRTIVDCTSLVRPATTSSLSTPHRFMCIAPPQQKAQRLLRSACAEGRRTRVAVTRL